VFILHGIFILDVPLGNFYGLGSPDLFYGPVSGFVKGIMNFGSHKGEMDKCESLSADPTPHK
jgi:hypothetical protein